MEGYATDAAVIRLVAAGDTPLSATQGITIGGISYGNGGTKSGTKKVEVAKLKDNRNGGGLLSVYMPPGSAALVRLPVAKQAAYEQLAGQSSTPAAMP